MTWARRGHPPAEPHTLRSVSTEPAGTSPRDEDSDVRVPDTVLTKMRELPDRAASQVDRTILSIPAAEGEPIRLNVPGDPPGTRYWALIPGYELAPVVIYRRSLPSEEGRWLVTALMDQRAYFEYSHHGLADSNVVQGVATAVAVGGTVSTDYDPRRA